MYYEHFDMSNAARERHTQCSRASYYLNAVFLCVFSFAHFVCTITHAQAVIHSAYIFLYVICSQTFDRVYNRRIANIIEKHKYTSKPIFNFSSLVCLLLLRFSEFTLEHLSVWVQCGSVHAHLSLHITPFRCERASIPNKTRHIQI